MHRTSLDMTYISIAICNFKIDISLS